MTQDTKLILKEMNIPAINDVVTASGSVKVRIHTTSGLPNSNNNCWLNSGLQVLLGTALQEYLVRPEFEGYRVTDNLKRIYMALSNEKQPTRYEDAFQAAKNLASYLGMESRDVQIFD